MATLLHDGTTARPRPLFPGAVLAVDGPGGSRTWTAGVTRAYGDVDGEPLPASARLPVRPDTVYDLASLTKLVTATTVVVLAERGVLGLDDVATRYLPDFVGTGVTLRQLLTHTSGLPAESTAWRDEPDPAARRAAVLAHPLVAAPGTTFRYSCVGYLVLGLVVEQVAGPLDLVVRQEVTAPLGLAGLGYRPLNHGVDPDRIAATETGPGRARGLVHDESSASWGGAAGNAGLFGTAADLLGLGRALLDRLAGRSSPLALSPTAARAMVTDQAPGTGAGFGAGLGWRIDDPDFLGPLVGRGRTYGHTGFTGTSLLVDEDRDLVAVLLTNRVHPSRAWSELQPFRRAVAEELATDHPLRRPVRSAGR